MIYNEHKDFTPSNLGETKTLDVVTLFTRGSAYIKNSLPLVLFLLPLISFCLKRWCPTLAKIPSAFLFFTC
jgi:hypothetical protein